MSRKQKYIIITLVPKLLYKSFTPQILKKKCFGKYKNDKFIISQAKTKAQSRNISDYENKSKEDLKKALSKSETKPKIEIKVNKKKLKKLRRDLDELRHTFSNKDEIREYRKVFYEAKKYELFESETDKTNNNLTKFKKSVKSKKFHADIDSVDYENLNNFDNSYNFADDDKYRAIGSIRTLFKELDRDYKPIRTDGGFAGRNNNYIEYTSKGERYESLFLLPKEYLDVIRPYLKILVNNLKPTTELNNNNDNNNSNNNNNKNNNDNNNNNEDDRTEWKIQLVIQNNFISDKTFEDTCTIYSASRPLEIFMGSDIENAIDKLFNTI